MRELADGGACSECTTNCLLVHKNPMYPFNYVDRFLKTISGKDLAEVMFLPSRVAREQKWRKYINREACLEDTTGEKYPVKISKVENAVAFTEGWCRFSSEHHLAEGDFVLFSHVLHVGKLHFVVHIYGKSGLEKVFFRRGNDMNVSTMNRNTAFLNETVEAVTSDSKKSPSSSVVSKPLCGEYTEGEMLHHDHVHLDMDPLYMVNRDAQFVDNRICLLDLSSFEKLEEHTTAVEVRITNDEAGTMSHADKMIEYPTDSNLPDTFQKKRKFSTQVPRPYKKEDDIIEIESAPVTVAPRITMAVNAAVRSCTRVSKMIVPRDKFGLADNIPVQRDISISETPSYKQKLDHKKNIDSSGSAYSAEDKRRKVATGDAFKIVKRELNTGDDKLFDHRRHLNVKNRTISPKSIIRSSSNVKTDFKIPKTESSFSEDVFRECSSAVVDDKPYLLLQSELPSVLSHGEKLRVIYLRAPDRKVWPVMYQQRNGVIVLTSGWRVFKAMCHLHAGCRCRIELEEASKRVYGFEVLLASEVRAIVLNQYQGA